MGRLLILHFVGGANVELEKFHRARAASLSA